MPTRSYSTQTGLALQLLAKHIKLARKQRRWSESELAQRAGVSRATVQKIERADPGCQIGLVFEAASLVGVPLFLAESPSLGALNEAADARLALLPKRIHGRDAPVDDDF
ncbi:MAG: helix-turn-helix transcriptional regulator [Gammaproteobacteria bacterium]